MSFAIAAVVVVVLVVFGWRFRWWRSLRGWVSYVLRRSPHPALVGSRQIRLDPAVLRAAAVEGVAIALPLGSDFHVEVAVAPVHVIGDAAQALVLGDGGSEEVVESDLATFAGSVAGDDESDVRLTITDTTVTGYVRCEAGWFFIDPLAKFRRGADPSQFVVYRAEDVALRLPFGDDGRLAETSDPDDGADHRVNPHVGLAIWADEQYKAQVDLISLTWTQALASLVNMVNGIYERQLGIEFVIRHFVLDLRSSTLTTSDAEDLLDQFGEVVRDLHGDIRLLSVRQNTGIEVAHLATTRNLKGTTLGVAWQPGVWGLSQQAVAIRIFGITIPLFSAYGNMMVAAHELGHNFTGDHGHADEVCVTHFIWCWDYERTIMWPTYYSDNQDRFSKTNGSRISTNAQTGRAVNFSHP